MVTWSVVKMDILPRVNFFFSMLPLTPPHKYWQKLQSLVSQFIWKGKQPWIKTSTLQRHRAQGGLSVPNFKLYFWSFIFRPISVWLNPNASVSWRPVEERLASPNQFQDLIHSALSCKQAKQRLGPIVSYLLTVWRAAEKSLKPGQKWHLNTPIFNNYSLLTGKAPFTFPAWRDRGIQRESGG